MSGVDDVNGVNDNGDDDDGDMIRIKNSGDADDGGVMIKEIVLSDVSFSVGSSSHTDGGGGGGKDDDDDLSDVSFSVGSSSGHDPRDDEEDNDVIVVDNFLNDDDDDDDEDYPPPIRVSMSEDVENDKEKNEKTKNEQSFVSFATTFPMSGMGRPPMTTPTYDDRSALEANSEDAILSYPWSGNDCVVLPDLVPTDRGLWWSRLYGGIYGALVLPDQPYNHKSVTYFLNNRTKTSNLYDSGQCAILHEAQLHDHFRHQPQPLAHKEPKAGSGAMQQLRFANATMPAVVLPRQLFLVEMCDTLTKNPQQHNIHHSIGGAEVCSVVKLLWLSSERCVPSLDTSTVYALVPWGVYLSELVVFRVSPSLDTVGDDDGIVCSVDLSGRILQIVVQRQRTSLGDNMCKFALVGVRTHTHVHCVMVREDSGGYVTLEVVNSREQALTWITPNPSIFSEFMGATSDGDLICWRMSNGDDLIVRRRELAIARSVYVESEVNEKLYPTVHFIESPRHALVLYGGLLYKIDFSIISNIVGTPLRLSLVTIDTEESTYILACATATSRFPYLVCVVTRCAVFLFDIRQPRRALLHWCTPKSWADRSLEVCCSVELTQWMENEAIVLRWSCRIPNSEVVRHTESCGVLVFQFSRTPSTSGNAPRSFIAVDAPLWVSAFDASVPIGIPCRRFRVVDRVSPVIGACVAHTNDRNGWIVLQMNVEGALRARIVGSIGFECSKIEKQKQHTKCGGHRMPRWWEGEWLLQKHVILDFRELVRKLRTEVVPQVIDGDVAMTNMVYASVGSKLHDFLRQPHTLGEVVRRAYQSIKKFKRSSVRMHQLSTLEYKIAHAVIHIINDGLIQDIRWFRHYDTVVSSRVCARNHDEYAYLNPCDVWWCSEWWCVRVYRKRLCALKWIDDPRAPTKVVDLSQDVGLLKRASQGEDVFDEITPHAQQTVDPVLGLLWELSEEWKAVEADCDQQAEQ